MICHLELKPGVRLHRTSAEIMFATEVVREVWEEYGASVCRVTAGVDGVHSPLGEHYKGDALDFSTRTIPLPVTSLMSVGAEASRQERINQAIAAVAMRLDASYLKTDDKGNRMFQGANFFLMLEDVGQPNEHLHVSYRPQALG